MKHLLILIHFIFLYAIGYSQSSEDESLLLEISKSMLIYDLVVMDESFYYLSNRGLGTIENGTNNFFNLQLVTNRINLYSLSDIENFDSNNFDYFHLLEMNNKIFIFSNKHFLLLTDNYISLHEYGDLELENYVIEEIYTSDNDYFIILFLNLVSNTSLVYLYNLVDSSFSFIEFNILLENYFEFNYINLIQYYLTTIGDFTYINETDTYREKFNKNYLYFDKGYFNTKLKKYSDSLVFVNNDLTIYSYKNGSLSLLSQEKFNGFPRVDFLLIQDKIYIGNNIGFFVYNSSTNSINSINLPLMASNCYGGIKKIIHYKDKLILLGGTHLAGEFKYCQSIYFYNLF